MSRGDKNENRSTNDHTVTLLAALGIELPRRASAVIPDVPGIDWSRVAADPKTPVVFTDREPTAMRLCSQGQAAIAVTGISKGKLAKWLRKHGARVRDKSDAH